MEFTKQQPGRINEDIHCAGEEPPESLASALGALGLVTGPIITQSLWLQRPEKHRGSLGHELSPGGLQLVHWGPQNAGLSD